MIGSDHNLTRLNAARRGRSASRVMLGLSIFAPLVVGLTSLAPMQAAAQSSDRQRICQRLERELVRENRTDGNPREELSRLRSERRQLSSEVGRLEQRLESGNCYETFLFSRTLRRTRACVRMKRSLDTKRGQLTQVVARLRRMDRSRSQGDRRTALIRQLARYNCGQQYERAVSRTRSQRSWNPFSVFDRDSTRFYDNAPRAIEPNTVIEAGYTYRTMCVRLCDGYYFPVSFSALPTKFTSDADVCQQRCAAPTQLYVYRSPGGEVEQMITPTGEPYRDMKAAYQYRKKAVPGCSCRLDEYNAALVAAAQEAADGKRTAALEPPAQQWPAGGLVKIKPKRFDTEGNETSMDDGADDAPIDVEVLAATPADGGPAPGDETEGGDAVRDNLGAENPQDDYATETIDDGSDDGGPAGNGTRVDVTTASGTSPDLRGAPARIAPRPVPVSPRSDPTGWGAVRPAPPGYQQRQGPEAIRPVPLEPFSRSAE